VREGDESEADGRREEEEKEEVQARKEEKRAEELCVVLCNCHICEHQHGHRTETGDSYKKCSTPCCCDVNDKREKKRKKEGKMKRESCSMVKQQQ